MLRAIHSNFSGFEARCPVRSKPFPGDQMFRIVCIALFLSCSLIAEELHEFAGKHFFASYLKCDSQALSDVDHLIQAMNHAVEASGATILDQTSYVFPPAGLTIVYLLSESHASLHTYPEHGACFVDIFTCGDQCIPEKFDAALRAYLQPEKASSRLFLRHEDIEELSHD